MRTPKNHKPLLRETQMFRTIIAIAMLHLIPHTQAQDCINGVCKMRIKTTTTNAAPAGAAMPTFQAVAQERANALAYADRLTHGIAKLVPGTPEIPAGLNEGIGYSTAGEPPTCEPPGTIVGDARATSPSGRTYRVRLFSPMGGVAAGSDDTSSTHNRDHHNHHRLRLRVLSRR